jgi:hypothetical protein
VADELVAQHDWPAVGGLEALGLNDGAVGVQGERNVRRQIAVEVGCAVAQDGVLVGPVERRLAAAGEVGELACKQRPAGLAEVPSLLAGL